MAFEGPPDLTLSSLQSHLLPLCQHCTVWSTRAHAPLFPPRPVPGMSLPHAPTPKIGPQWDSALESRPQGSLAQCPCGHHSSICV